MSVEAPPEMSKLSNTQWQNPEFPVPMPSLEFLFHLECEMMDFADVGPGPYGDRKTVIFKGGRFEGPRLRGTIMQGGGGNTYLSQASLLQE